MQEKKYIEKDTPLELKKVPTEILVARGRSFEPFIKTFVQSGDNISRFDLGTLVGVFEVNEQSEDSAYIVNFLASVAKKEYFSNPRRGAIESFEAALHKVNLALAELVKHGNVSWLGSLHGVLGVLEKNNVHFSATGQGSILLLRNDGLTNIGDGLASEEAAAHPIKTFMEISSGRLLDGDRLVFSSPELLTLFSQENLLKNALRMDEDRFDQFLKTALINELDMAGTILIHIKEETTPQKKSPEHKREVTVKPTPTKNVFSQAAFTAKQNDPITPYTDPSEIGKQEEEISNEYVDSKTGHIYVQGNAPKEPSDHPIVERLGIFIQETGASLRTSFGAQSKWARKGRKRFVITAANASESIHSAIDQSIASIKRTLARRREQAAAAKTATPSESSLAPAEPTSKVVPVHIQESAPRVQPVATSDHANQTAEVVPDEVEIPLFIREKLSAFYKKRSSITENDPLQTTEAISTKSPTMRPRAVLASAWKSIQPAIARASSIVTTQTRLFTRKSASVIKRTTRRVALLPPRQKAIALGVTALIVSSGLFLLFRYTPKEQTAAPVVTSPETSTSEFPIDTEKNARAIGEPTIIAQQSGLVGAATLDGKVFAIFSGGITDVSENKTFPLPTDSGRATLSATMRDLRLIFIYTDTGNLFAWSPISHTFAKNTLNLPSGASLRSIGTYLTYLYALDGTNGQVYRFPRADGGFGAPTNWLRDTLPASDSMRMAVSESIYLSQENTPLQSFFRGRPEKVFESPNSPLSIASIAIDNTQTVYALDTTGQRIITWNQDGSITAQYFSERLSRASAITVSRETGEIFITTDDTLLSFRP